MNIIIVDDDPFVTGALKTILESTGEITVKATGTDGKEACELYEKYQPDVKKPPDWVAFKFRWCRRRDLNPHARYVGTSTSS